MTYREFLEDIFIVLTLPIALPMNTLIRSSWGDRFFRKLPYHPRFIHWLIAIWGGLFWLPCPLCGKRFGGHEPTGTLMVSFSSGQGVCRKCAHKAKTMMAFSMPEGSMS
jgi:hypothetical protein